MSDRRWAAFAVLSLGALMIVLDSTVVNVALPSIQASLGFSPAGLAWVVNAYMLTFGGFLLLGGRLGDLLGPRRVFLAGVAAFTLASLACGLAPNPAWLVVARAIQGVGGAVTSAVSLSLIMGLFPEPDARAKAMGAFGFVSAGGGSLGLLVGGVLTSALNWHWIFLVNLPIGLGVALATLAIVPAKPRLQPRGPLDILGAVTVTLALLCAVAGVVQQAWWLLGAAALLLAAFLLVERRARAPLVPLALFRSRNVTVANVVGVLWAAAMFSWFFLAALYMQLVLGYDALHVGLGFLVGNVIMAIFSVGLSARIVTRFGLRGPMALGLGLAALGLALFARAPVGGGYVLDILPAMTLLGFGAGLAFNPVLLAAMGDVPPEDAGLASGVVNTSFMMGGALGLAVLASAAAARTRALAGGGVATPAALTGGYHAAFLLGAGFAALAALLGATLLRPARAPTEPGAAPALA
jgi:EmrB/QacA subfamily drug resistance transporter